jgi:hypothetical protein
LTRTHSQLHKISGAQVWRGSATTTHPTGFLAFGWTWSLGYGLDFLLDFWLFLLGALPLEKGELALVGYWSATRIIMSVKVKVLRGWPLCLWLGDNIVILSMKKTSTSLYF